MNQEKLIEILTAVILTVGGILLNYIYILFKTRKVELKNHRLFTSLHKAKIEINSWIIPENREVIRRMLLIKIECWLKQGLQLADELDKNIWKFNKRKLKSKIDNWTISVIEQYSDEWYKIGVHKILIQKINNNHQSKVDFIMSSIQEAIYSEVYITNKLKINNIFDVLTTLLAETKNDFLAWIFMTEFNGDLLGVKFENIPINDKEYQKYLENKHKKQ